jgi:hypothetical protein
MSERQADAYGGNLSIEAAIVRHECQATGLLRLDAACAILTVPWEDWS